MATAQETYAMLEKESLWATATRCHQASAAREIPHAVIGGVAVCLHGYQRTTVDIDLLVIPGMAEQVRECLEAAGFQWDASDREFRDASGVAVQFLVAGERAGKGSDVTLPDPRDPATIETLEGLPVASLERLIEMKIACGEGNIHRTHKAFADLVELIASHDLDGTFAARLHKSVRHTFRRLLKHAGGGA